MQFNNPPFISTQRLQWWTRSISEFFRSGLNVDSAEESLKLRARNRASGDESQDDRWRSIARLDLIRERETSPATTPLPDFSRVVIAVDSGMGKSTLLRRLCCEIARARPLMLPIRLEVADLPPLTESYVNDEQILKALVGCLRRLRNADAVGSAKSRANERFPEDDRQVLAWLRSERSKGRIVLLIDAVDQATEQSRIDTLKYLLKMSEWSACQMIVTGRPPAISDLDRVTDLFKNPKGPWQLVRLLGFTPQESEQFIGSARWATLPDEVRHLLATPRVCQYLRLIDDMDWREIRTESDIYFHSLRGMVRAGLRSVDVREFLPTKYANWKRPKLVGKQIEEASLTHQEEYERELVMCLLAATAFEVLCLKQPEGSKELPNRVSTKDYDLGFVERVRQRVEKQHAGWTDAGTFLLAFKELATVNVALEALFFETNCNVTVTKLQFRDATIKEWFAAYWCAKYEFDVEAQPRQAVPSLAPGCARREINVEAKRIENWIYRPDRPLQDQDSNPQYRLFWKCLCEMPVGGRSPKSWPSAIAPLYLPSKAGRSCEMMYRAWQTLTEYRDIGNAQAQLIVNTFLAEFPTILNGPDLERAKIAAQLVPEHVLKTLVSPKRFKQICPPAAEPAFVRCPPWEVEEAERKEYGGIIPSEGLHCYTFHMGTDARMGERYFESWFDGEVPRHRVRLREAFDFQATTVSREQFQLFDPSHDVAWERYDISWETNDVGLESLITKEISETLDYPVVNVSWFQSWCFALWCGMSLPTEVEWEFAVRAGRDGETAFFSTGKSISSFQANINGIFASSVFVLNSIDGPSIGGTVPVRSRRPPVNEDLMQRVERDALQQIDYRPNRWGVFHPIGNVRVWCLDWYSSDAYSRRVQKAKAKKVAKQEVDEMVLIDDPPRPPSGRIRVNRGGCWNDEPLACRVADRGSAKIFDQRAVTGIRLVRVSSCERTS